MVADDRWRAVILYPDLALVLAYWVHASPIWIFATAAIAIYPLADGIRRATDSLANRAGPAIGGLVTIRFLALFVLATGDTATVKAQITGSLIGTSLLALGVAILAGGWKRENKTSSRSGRGSSAAYLSCRSLRCCYPLFLTSPNATVLGMVML